MKKKLITIFSILIFILVILFTILYHLKTNPSDKNKDISTQINRKKYIISEDKNLYDFTNKESKTLIVFWATWCSYCIDEADALNEYISSNPYNSIIVVSHDNDIDELNKYLDEKGYNWFVIFDPEKTIRENLDPESTGIPSSYLLDKDGKIINFHKGKLTLEQFQIFFNGVEI